MKLQQQTNTKIPSRDFGCDACKMCSLPIRQRHKWSREIHEQLRPLYKLDNFHAFFAALSNIIMVMLSIVAVIGMYSLHPALGILIYIPANIFIGSRQRASATLLHESAHLTLARNRIWNFILGTFLSGYWIFQTWMPYKSSHVGRHHKYLGDETQDPDIMFYIQQGLLDEVDDPNMLQKQMIKTLLGFRTFSYLKYLFLNRIFPRYLFIPLADIAPRLRPMKIRERRLSIAEYLLFVMFWLAIVIILTKLNLLLPFVVFWIVPYITSFQIIGWVIELCEHYPLTKYSDYDIYMTRNRLGNHFEQFLTGVHGENWHLIHHLIPGIPFWNLAEANEILLQDEVYARVSERSGGIFTTGTNGAPSIIQSMNDQLQKPSGVLNSQTTA